MQLHCVNHIEIKLQIMNLKHFLFTILLLTFSTSFVNAQNRDTYYPQVPFDSVQAKEMLGLGKSGIEGLAYTKEKTQLGYKAPLGPKILAQNVVVTLFPVTPYFEEWYKLRRKMENKKTSVFMSEQAFRFRITVNTDEYGRFKFTQMKPGKYFVQTFATYSRTGTASVYRGSGYNGYGVTDYYEYQTYTNNYSDRLEKFVEVTRDNQTIEIKLK
jgi:hypothetical protein